MSIDNITAKGGGFPLQKLSIKKKDEDWRKQCVEFFVSSSFQTDHNNMTRLDRLRRNYNLYNGKIRKSDFLYVTNPYDIETDDAFPSNLRNINILRTEIDLLIGEETKRPFSYSCFQTSQQIISNTIQQKDEGIKQILEQMIEGDLMMKYGPMLQEMTKEQQQQLSEEANAMMQKALQNHINHSSKDEMEEASNHYLKWVAQKYNLNDKFITCWKDALIGAIELMYIGKENNRPAPRRANPRYFDYDKDPDLEFIENGDWCVYLTYMYPSSVLDRFGDILSDSDKDAIMTDSRTDVLGKPSQVNYTFVRRTIPLNDDDIELNGNMYAVYHVCWRSFVKIGYRTYFDDFGRQQMDMVDEYYQPMENETIEWDWKVQIWEGWKIGDNIYTGIHPTEYENLPYVGIVFNDSNSEPVSMVDIMFPITVIYIIAWYRLELTMARDRGRIINMDVTQIPESLGINRNQWLHYLSANGVNFINPYENSTEGIHREGPASFNQFGQVDLSMGNVLGEYIQLLNKIEDLMGYISGVTKQRLGSISNYELVGNVERSVIQSSHITEPWFYRHNIFKRNVLKALLEAGQMMYDGNDEFLSYIMDDMTKIVWKMPKNWDLSEMDIHVGDSGAEHQRVNALRALAQPAMSAGASLYEVGMLYVKDTTSEILNELKEVDDRRKQAEQAAAQQQGKIEEARIAQAKEAAAEANAVAERNSIRQSNTQIEVALINTEQNNNNASNESIEERKMNLEEQKERNDVRLREEELDETKRSNKKDEEIKLKSVNKPMGTKK